jgi:NADH-quinone oxidoreductase subunit M
MLITLASIGLPGTNGFVGEFLILLGVFRWDPRLAAFAATGVILSAVYMLWMFQRVNYGPIVHEENRALPDLTRRERWVIVPAVAMAIFMGVFPGVFLKPMQPSVERFLQRMSRPSVARAVGAPSPNPAEAAWRGAAPSGASPSDASVKH